MHQTPNAATQKATATNPAKTVRPASVVNAMSAAHAKVKAVVANAPRKTPTCAMPLRLTHKVKSKTPVPLKATWATAPKDANPVNLVKAAAAAVVVVVAVASAAPAKTKAVPTALTTAKPNWVLPKQMPTPHRPPVTRQIPTDKPLAMTTVTRTANPAKSVHVTVMAANVRPALSVVTMPRPRPSRPLRRS